MSAVDLSIIVPIRNQLAHNQFFVDTLTAFSTVRRELIVVDNGSTDGSSEWLRKVGARVIATGGNLCYPESMNLGMAEARGAYLGFLNNDIVVSPGWDVELIGALERHRLSVVSPVGIERMPSDGLTRAVQERWRLVKRRVGPVEDAEQLRRALDIMYGDWRTFCGEIRATFPERKIPGIVGSCVLVSRQIMQRIEGWDPRVQAADWDLYLRLRENAPMDLAPPMIAGWVYVHHYVQATRRGERAPFTCTHPRLTVQEKWGEAAIRRWFFDPPLLAPPRFAGAPAAFLCARAARIRKDLARSAAAIKALACGFPGADELLARVTRERTSG